MIQDETKQNKTICLHRNNPQVELLTVLKKIFLYNSHGPEIGLQKMVITNEFALLGTF